MHLHLTSREQAAAVTVGVLAIASSSVLWMRRPRPSPETVEELRRGRLALTGRITDGSLVDTTTVDGSFLESRNLAWTTTSDLTLLIFRYRVGGVAYEAVQDVSTLRDRVQGLRIDLPVQVRYDHNNPADSIVVAESWSGLRLQNPAIASLHEPPPTSDVHS